MKRGFVRIFSIVLALCAVVVLSTPTLAQTKFLEKVRRQYMLDRTNGKCELCHEVKAKEEPSRKNLSAFGKAIQADPAMKPLLGKDDKYNFTPNDLATLVAAVKKIEDMDSDSDGVSNFEELELGTIPGDPKSIPEKLKLAKWRKDHPDRKPPAPASPAPAIGPKK